MRRRLLLLAGGEAFVCAEVGGILAEGVGSAAGGRVSPDEAGLRREDSGLLRLPCNEVEAEPVSTEVRTLGGGGEDGIGVTDSLIPEPDTSGFWAVSVSEGGSEGVLVS